MESTPARSLTAAQPLPPPRFGLIKLLELLVAGSQVVDEWAACSCWNRSFSMATAASGKSGRARSNFVTA